MGNFKGLVKIARDGISKNSPQILTALGVVGVYATAFLASKATLKAKDILAKEESKIPWREKLSKKDIVKLTWKSYIPAGLSSAITSFCIIKSGHIYASRHAATFALYSMTETALREYQDKVKSTIGDNKEQQIRDNVALDHIRNKPPELSNIWITGQGDVLCYDTPSGRYFKSDIEKIRRKENDFNQTLRTEMTLTLNELYYELGLEPTKLGDSTGWDIEKGLLTFRYSSQLTEEGTPCLVIDYDIHPLYPF